MVKFSFDIGGVLSKYPDIWRPIFKALQSSPDIEVFVITDMFEKDSALKMLYDNGFDIARENLYTADFTTYGESCKAVLLQQIGIDVHVDDFPAYVADGCPVRLLMQPDITKPYYHSSWITDGTEGNFGRKTQPDKEITPQDSSPMKEETRLQDEWLIKHGYHPNHTGIAIYTVNDEFIAPIDEFGLEYSTAEHIVAIHNERILIAGFENVRAFTEDQWHVMTINTKFSGLNQPSDEFPDAVLKTEDHPKGVQCSACDGLGRWADDIFCHHCDGKGYVNG